MKTFKEMTKDEKLALLKLPLDEKIFLLFSTSSRLTAIGKTV